jgi:LPPG:FO 2-phospho-L-lactate transferase
MRELITSREIPRVALSPIVEGQAIKGPAAKLMSELHYEASALAVAQYYDQIINGFVYDERDAALNLNLKQTVTFDTIMVTDEDRALLARKIMQWIEEWE